MQTRYVLTLGHERIILFGHSYGGFLAQEYALRYLQHIDGLILCCTAPALDYPEIIRSNAQARGTPQQVEAVNRLLSREAMFSDANLAETLALILPFYFKHYDPKVGTEIGKRFTTVRLHPITLLAPVSRRSTRCRVWVKLPSRRW
jgi:proline iminopeptidase